MPRKRGGLAQRVTSGGMKFSREIGQLPGLEGPELVPVTWITLASLPRF